MNRGLGAMLLEALGAPPDTAAARAAGSALRAMHARGAASWPGVVLAATDFVAHLAAHLPGDREPLAALAALHGEDLYLACACARGDARGIAELDRIITALVPRFLEPGERGMAEEVQQELRGKLLVPRAGRPAGIADFGGAGSLASWLRIAAVRCARNLRRGERRRAAHRDELGADELLRAPDPEADVLRLRFAAPFQAALHDAMAALTPRQRNLLRLHYLDGIPLDRLGRLHNVSRATATRWVAAARQVLLDETVARLRARLNLERKEIESLLRFVQSHLELSIQPSLVISGR